MKQMMPRKSTWVFAAICATLSLSVIAAFFILRPGAPRPIVYSTELDRESSIVLISPTSKDCTSSKLHEIKIPNLQEVRLIADKIVYREQALGDKFAQYWLLEPREAQTLPLGPPLAVNPDNGEETLLSPSLRYIAIAHQATRTDPFHTSLEIIDRQTDTPRQVMTETGWSGWSPVKDVLAIEKSSGQLALVTPEGEIQKEYEPRPWMRGMSWSSDGQHITFESEFTLEGKNTQVMEIYNLDLETGRITQLTNNRNNYEKRWITFAIWSPNNQYIAFISSDQIDSSGTQSFDSLYVLDTLSRQETKIANGVRWSWPVWDASSQRLAFISTTKDNNFGEVFIYDVDTGKQTQLTCDQQLKKGLSWSGL